MSALTLESFTQQCLSVSQLLNISDDVYNLGEFSAKANNGVTITVIGGDNILGTRAELVGGPFLWKVSFPSYSLTKMASGSFVRKPSMSRGQGNTLAEALQNAGWPSLLVNRNP